MFGVAVFGSCSSAPADISVVHPRGCYRGLRKGLESLHCPPGTGGSRWRYCSMEPGQLVKARIRKESQNLEGVFQKFIAIPEVAAWLLQRTENDAVDPRIFDDAFSVGVYMYNSDTACIPRAVAEIPYPDLPDVGELNFTTHTVRGYALGFISTKCTVHPLKYAASRIALDGWETLATRRFATHITEAGEIQSLEFSWFTDTSSIVIVRSAPLAAGGQFYGITDAFFFPPTPLHRIPRDPQLVIRVRDSPRCDYCFSVDRIVCECPSHKKKMAWNKDRALQCLFADPNPAHMNARVCWSRYVKAISELNPLGRLTCIFSIPTHEGGFKKDMIVAKVVRDYAMSFGAEDTKEGIQRHLGRINRSLISPLNRGILTLNMCVGYRENDLIRGTSQWQNDMGNAHEAGLASSFVDELCDIADNSSLVMDSVGSESDVPEDKDVQVLDITSPRPLGQPFDDTRSSSLSLESVSARPAIDTFVDSGLHSPVTSSDSSVGQDVNARVTVKEEVGTPTSFHEQSPASPKDVREQNYTGLCSSSRPDYVTGSSTEDFGSSEVPTTPADSSRESLSKTDGPTMKEEDHCYTSYRKGDHPSPPLSDVSVEISTPPASKSNSSRSNKNNGRMSTKPTGGVGSCVCEICNQTFSKRSNLVRHTKTVHNREKPFSCTMCASKFGHKADLTRHFRNLHENRSFCCNTCGKSFTTQGQLSLHIRVTHEKAAKPFECQLCGVGFGRKSSMRRHHQTVHEHARFPCRICGKSYSQKFDCERHCQREHGCSMTENVQAPQATPGTQAVQAAQAAR